MIGVSKELVGDELKQVISVIDDQKALLRWPKIKIPYIGFEVRPKTFDKKRDVLCRVQSTGTYVFLLPFRGDFALDVSMLVRPRVLVLEGRFEEFGKHLYKFTYKEPRKYVELNFNVLFLRPQKALDEILGIGE